ncbi:hypothetical protein ABPG72_011500 [Tetrahymena utriculariae]
MKLNLQDTDVKDFQSLFKGQSNIIENLEIHMSKVNFLQDKGFIQFIQGLQIYENTKQITLILKEQQIGYEEIQSLSLVISKLKKLPILQLSFENKQLLADEYKILLNSISGNPCIKQVYITCGQKDLDSEECQAIQNFVNKSKSLNKLKLKQGNGLIQYGIINSSFDKDVQIAIGNVNLFFKKEFILLASPLIQLGKIEKMNLDISNNVENLILKITCGQINIKKSLEQNLTLEIEKVQYLFDLISINDTNEMKFVIQQITKLEKLSQLKINFKLDKDLLKFDMFNFFIESMALNYNVQEIYINFSNLKILINFQDIALKIKDMVNIKKLTIQYEIQQLSNKSLIPETQVVIKEFDRNELKATYKKS